MKMISSCPTCGSKLSISSLRCPDCGLELRNDFEATPFDFLSSEQWELLITFLKHRGNMRSVQNELGISYPTAKKRFDNLLAALDLAEENQQERGKDLEIDMSSWSISKDSVKASDIIKRKLVESGGRAMVYTVRGLPCEISAAPDGLSFFSDKLPVNPPYQYKVFDRIVELLSAQGGRAKKGNGRGHKLGEPECDETTVVGAIGYFYHHVEAGKSVYDPVFVLSAILDWAGIAHNERGELILTASYQEALQSAGK